jgi:hypothetical protein
MATWHITVHLDKGTDFQQRFNCILVSNWLAQEGFVVQPMPLRSTEYITVSHTANSAMSLFLLKYSALLNNSGFDSVQIS